ncbi:tail fiber assembly protein [Pseudomonas sp. stari2]|uniref:tail fiber assembly protein n=1 Tax=Pseudomonas sp. Stari2 TaxID=2954814 RepID=UPI00345D039F
MNRYVLLESTGTNFSIVTQVIDTESYTAPAVPNGSKGFWLWVPENTIVQVGWIARNGATGTTFTAPTDEDKVVIVVSRTRMLLLAALDWLPHHTLQYRVDIGVATPAEQASLLAFKQYVIALDEVKNQTGYPTEINWPVAPF